MQLPIIDLVIKTYKVFPHYFLKTITSYYLLFWLSVAALCSVGEVYTLPLQSPIIYVMLSLLKLFSHVIINIYILQLMIKGDKPPTKYIFPLWNKQGIKYLIVLVVISLTVTSLISILILKANIYLNTLYMEPMLGILFCIITVYVFIRLSLVLPYVLTETKTHPWNQIIKVSWSLLNGKVLRILLIDLLVFMGISLIFVILFLLFLVATTPEKLFIIVKLFLSQNIGNPLFYICYISIDVLSELSTAIFNLYPLSQIYLLHKEAMFLKLDVTTSKRKEG